MGTADTETGWDIYGTDPGASQSKHCKEAVFSDVFIWALNGRGKGKSVQVDPQVKLHYLIQRTNLTALRLHGKVDP